MLDRAGGEMPRPDWPRLGAALMWAYLPICWPQALTTQGGAPPAWRAELSSAGGKLARLQPLQTHTSALNLLFRVYV